MKEKIKNIGGILLQKIGLITSKPLLFDISCCERMVEYAWVLRNLDIEKSKILDLGCYGTLFPIMLASLGHKVTGIDRKDYEYKHPNFTFIKGDILDFPPQLLNQKFDVIISISTIEHVGLGSKENIIEDGDIKAVKELKKMLKDNSTLFLTFGYGGKFQIHKLLSSPDIPFGRLYDEERIEKLSKGFEIVKKDYFKIEDGVWNLCTIKEAKKFIYPETWDKTMSIVCIKLKKRSV